jgi:hypothetical protein
MGLTMERLNVFNDTQNDIKYTSTLFLF